MVFGRKERRIVRLLLCEDNPLVAFDNEYRLGSEGYEIVATLDSVAASVALIERGTAIDLVLADLDLTDGSGIDIARAAQARGIPVVFVTGNCPGDARHLAVGCLAKPYAQRDLLAAIAAVDQLAGGKRPKRLPPAFSLFLEPAS